MIGLNNKAEIDIPNYVSKPTVKCKAIIDNVETTVMNSTFYMYC